MPLDLLRLQKVRHQADGSVIARCPACASVGADKGGNHLRVWSDGRFACVVASGPSGKAHRQLVWRLAGEQRRTRPRPIIRYRITQA